MPLQSSGSITFANIQAEFGGTNPIGINEYYLNGTSGYVAGSGSTGVPTSGQISLGSFYGKYKVVVAVPTPVATNFVGTYVHPGYPLGDVIDVITGSSGANSTRTGVSTFNNIGTYSLTNKPSNLLYFPNLILQAIAGDTIQIRVSWAKAANFAFTRYVTIYLLINFGSGYSIVSSIATQPATYIPVSGTSTFNYVIPSTTTPGNYSIGVVVNNQGGGNVNAYYYSLHIYTL